MRRMFKPVPLFIGLRYNAAKRKNHFISFVSLASILGLTLGVAVLIVVLSVMNGFDRELQNRILGMIPHAALHSYDPLTDWQSLAKKAKQNPQVIGAAPFVHMQGMLTHQGSVSGVFVNGIDPVAEHEVSILDGFVKPGGVNLLKAGEFNMILGRTLAYQLGVGVGDKVTLVLPEASITPAGVLPRFKRFTVVGFFEVGAELDGMMAYIHIADASRLKRQPGVVDGVRLKVKDLFAAGHIVKEMSVHLGGRYYTSDWTDTHGNLFRAIKMEKSMVALLLLLIVAVAAFNIVSSLVMLVREKQSDIAILKTLGATPGTIRAIFIIQGTIVGFVGTIAGTIIGVVVALNIAGFAAWLEETFQLHLLAFYFVNYLPSELRLEDVVIVTSVAFVLSILATIYPSSRAAKTEPAEALRYE